MSERRAEKRWCLPLPESRAVFQERVLCLCAIHGLSTTSGVRSYERNKSVGGSADSKHLLEFGGWAVDVIGPALSDTPQDVLRDAEALGLLTFLEGDHLHLQGKSLGP